MTVPAGYKKVLLNLLVTDVFFILFFAGFGQLSLPHGIFTKGELSCDGRLCTAEEKTLTGTVFRTFSFEQQNAREIHVDKASRGYRLWIAKDYISSCTDCALLNRASFPFIWFSRSPAEKLREKAIKNEPAFYDQYSLSLRWLSAVVLATFVLVSVLYKIGAISREA